MVLKTLNSAAWYAQCHKQPTKKFHHFADDIFQFISLDGDRCILQLISLKFVVKITRSVVSTRIV